MFKRPLACVVLSALLFGCGPQPLSVPKAETAKVSRLSPSPASPTIQFVTVANGLKDGSAKATLARGWLCITYRKVEYNEKTAKSFEFAESFQTRFAAAVANELAASGYNIVDTTQDPLKRASGIKPGYYLAATLLEIQRHLCHPAGTVTEQKGKLYYKVEWSLLDGRSEQVVYKGVTEGASELKETIESGRSVLVDRAAKALTRNLLAKEDFAKRFR